MKSGGPVADKICFFISTFYIAKKKIKSKDIFIVFYVVFVFADLSLYFYIVEMVKMVDFNDAARARY